MPDLKIVKFRHPRPMELEFRLDPVVISDMKYEIPSPDRRWVNEKKRWEIDAAHKETIYKVFNRHGYTINETLG